MQFETFTASTPAQSLSRAASAGHSGGVAVVLNRNARAVTRRMIRRLHALHPRDHVFLSESFDHSRQIAEQLASSSYHTVLFGGGDGTFVCCLNDLREACRRKGRPLPRVGVLPLGTGNAIGYYQGIRPSLRGVAGQLSQARITDGAVHNLPLLRVNNRLTPFAGTGLDSQILEDYGATTRALDKMGLGRLIGSPLRYVLAVALRSVPRFVMRKLPEVEVVNVGGPAYSIGLDGQPDKTPLPRGTVLYRGRCTLAGAATVPCYGFGVRIFPFADVRKDMFHLRCTDASAGETLAHLPAVLRGDYRSPSLHDFLCDAVELRVSEPVPMQSGGDLIPDRSDRMRIDLADTTVSLITPA
ncbi:MAG TPA: diacylglycerol kinase family protein [Pseudomonadota bacterium]|jgi:diacylglycerol kinase family enzyme|nr:diacylglycerol kinase family protein [Pseudomonadota bacterium]HNK46995.1 diacylglycerol kinase family protein [Pseudomonadota bacterium]HNN53517.1 diacylglycerol kinase family protein [Pseudomonadota bacterium]